MNIFGKSKTEQSHYPSRPFSDNKAKSPRLFPLRGLTVAIGVTLLLLVFVGVKVWTGQRQTEKIMAVQLKTQHLIDEIVYFDEVLTMSARMAAATGQLAWESRYLDPWMGSSRCSASRAAIPTIPPLHRSTISRTASSVRRAPSSSRASRSRRESPRHFPG